MSASDLNTSPGGSPTAALPTGGSGEVGVTINVPKYTISINANPPVLIVGAAGVAKPGEFFFAWVDDPEPFVPSIHAVKDEHIIRLNRVFAKNDFPSLTLLVKKPDSELLAPDRKRWAWVSYRKLDNTIVPIFFGWLFGLPEDASETTVELLLLSQPLDLAEQKEAIAAGNRNLPYFDPAFIKPEERSDPDHILQAIPKVWHINHLHPLAVTLTHLVNGEDGHVTFQSGTQVPIDSVRRSLDSVPLRTVKITGTGFWIQSGAGEVDVKIPLLEAAAAAGTTATGVVTSYTGQGLADDFPKEDTKIGSGWSVKESHATYVKQVARTVKLAELPVTWSFSGFALDPMLALLRSLSTVPGDALFYLWHLIPHFVAKYEVNRRREEVITVTIEGDIQPVQTEPGDEEVLELTAVANDLNELVDAGGTLAPIRDNRSRAYFTSERGRKSVEFLMGVAARAIIERAQCAQVEFKVPFEDGIDPTCRMTATLVDPRYPGGVSGKIVGSSLLADPNAGEFSCTFLIACSVGEGNTVVAEGGEALYIDDEYIDEAYYARSGETFAAIDSNLTYEDFTQVPPNDDGTNFYDMTYQHCVQSCILVNGEDVQNAVLDNEGNDVFPDITNAVDALIEVASEYRLVLRPLEGSFKTEYNIIASGLMVAKTIDLRAVGP